MAVNVTYVGHTVARQVSGGSPMSAPNQSLKCSQWVRSIPLERFRLPGDGRKWQQVARSRKAFLLHLSSYANSDGTFVRAGRNYSPSLKTLLKDFCRGSYTQYSDDLRTLGLLSWTREKHYERRIYIIHLTGTVPTFTPKQCQDSPESVPRLDGEPPKQYQHSQKSVSASVPNPSLPSKEREPSLPSPPQAASENHLPLVQPEKSKAPQIVNPDDVDAVAATFCRLMDKHGAKYRDPKAGVDSGYGKPVARGDIEKMLRRCSRDEIIYALEYAFINAADDKAIKFMEKMFFANQGGIGLVVKRRQDEWVSSIQQYIDADDLDELPCDDLDELLKNDPIPVGLEIKGCDLITKARKNWKRLDAAKYPVCGGCGHRSGSIVEGACEDCRVATSTEGTKR